MVDYIDLSQISKATICDEKISLIIYPFHYTDDRKPRLPRKGSKKYDLMKDTAHCFRYAFDNLSREVDNLKYSVSITVHSGTDTLGGADLDNYCKAILDGVTQTQKIWKDDRQVDELFISRKYIANTKSFITLELSPMHQRS